MEHMPDRPPEAADPRIVIAWLSGNCPVQAEGKIDGLEFYFRARGEHWSLSIGGKDVILQPHWYYEETYGTGPFDAGWMPEEEAKAFLLKAAALFLGGAATMDIQ